MAGEVACLQDSVGTSGFDWLHSIRVSAYEFETGDSIIVITLFRKGCQPFHIGLTTDVAARLAEEIVRAVEATGAATDLKVMTH